MPARDGQPISRSVELSALIAGVGGVMGDLSPPSLPPLFPRHYNCNGRESSRRCSSSRDTIIKPQAIGL